MVSCRCQNKIWFPFSQSRPKTPLFMLYSSKPFCQRVSIHPLPFQLQIWESRCCSSSLIRLRRCRKSHHCIFSSGLLLKWKNKWCNLNLCDQHRNLHNELCCPIATQCVSSLHGFVTVLTLHNTLCILSWGSLLLYACWDSQSEFSSSTLPLVCKRWWNRVWLGEISFVNPLNYWNLRLKMRAGIHALTCETPAQQLVENWPFFALKRKTIAYEILFCFGWIPRNK